MSCMIGSVHDWFSSWEMSYHDSQTSYHNLQTSHIALVTRFDTFEARYQVDQEQCRSFEESEREQRWSFKDEQRAEWAHAAEREQQQQMYDAIS